MSTSLLQVQDLEVGFRLRDTEFSAVRGVSFPLAEGEALGIVGESGCGKSLTALALLGLVPPPGLILGGSVRFEGRDLCALPAEELRRVRGRHIGMVFQEPMTSLNPVFTVGYQLAEALTTHFQLPRDAVREKCLDLLTAVGVPDPAARLRAYPNQLSGGLRQRVMIAIAVACGPQLLIADEPTTALDVTIQAQIMDLLRRLRSDRRMALLLITHDLGLIAQNVERVLVMYAGRVVEEASTVSLFEEPLHPYTRGLLASMPGAGMVAKGEKLRAIAGTVPHPASLPSGCAFRDRCPLAVAECAAQVPELERKRATQWVRCLRVDACV